ncbi:MAG: peptidoglycan-binding protein [Clostridia bacterium]
MMRNIKNKNDGKRFFRVFKDGVKKTIASAAYRTSAFGIAVATATGAVLLVTSAFSSLSPVYAESSSAEDASSGYIAVNYNSNGEAQQRRGKPFEILSGASDGAPVEAREFAFGDINGFVPSVQDRLVSLGYLDIDETTMYFGPATKQAIIYFQRQSGLFETGSADLTTMAALFSDTSAFYAMQEGFEGEDVFDIQKQLIDLGYLKDADATSYYGTMTVDAVKKMQSKNVLPVTGIVDLETLDLLFSPEVKATEEAEKKIITKARINNFLDVAYAQIGKSYVRGATGPGSFDCSGLVYYCLRQAGSSRGRLNAAGYSRVSNWDKITSYGDLEKGDLVFFLDRGYSRVGHVGIYIGDGMMIDASTSAHSIGKRSIYLSYYTSRFVFARRPF